MLARRLTTILPAMTLAEALETTRIHSVADRTGDRTAWVTTRPFRAPHHTISDVGLIGGGQVPLPGEVSLAHHGILFLDELPEFRRHVLEVLRQPLEEGVVTITRVSRFATSLISRPHLAEAVSDSRYPDLNQRRLGIRQVSSARVSRGSVGSQRCSRLGVSRDV